MVKVNTYVAASIHGLRRADGFGGYLHEFSLSDGRKVTVPEEIEDRFMYCSDASETELILRALIEAFSRLTKPCEIKLYVDCPRVRQALSQDFISKWEASGWKTSKGEAVKDDLLWQSLADAMKEHSVSVADKDEKNEFSGWFRYEMEKRQHDLRTVSFSGQLMDVDSRPIRLS